MVTKRLPVLGWFFDGLLMDCWHLVFHAKNVCPTANQLPVGRLPVSHILVSSEDIGIVSSEDIGIVSSEDICIVSSEDICIEDICILSHLNVTNHNMRTAQPRARRSSYH